MGCFDYVCACNGTFCNHMGHQYQSSTVILEVPLLDESIIYLRGIYEQSGYVLVGDTLFYPAQFEDIFDENQSYKANKIWTYEEEDNKTDEQIRRNCFKEDIVKNFTDEIRERCIVRN